MNIEPCIPKQCSIIEATYRAYALQVIASESARDFPDVAALPLDTRLEEDLGIPAAGRLRIMSRLRDAFGSKLTASELIQLATLGQLLQSLAPQTAVSHL